MFPGVDGFHWTPGHLIFLGIFFAVLLVIVATVALASMRALRDADAAGIEAIRWEGDFFDLPERDRVCRHELTGEFPRRTCQLKFDCRQCQTHAKWIAQHPAGPGADSIFGLEYPLDRMYHRGHTWAKMEADGTVTVGLDELGRRLIGEPDAIEWPPAGSRVVVNGTAWRMERKGAGVRVLSPVDGDVLETGGPATGWYLKIRPEPDAAMTHLLRGAEVKSWIGRELEKLQSLVADESGAAAVATLADGGVLLEDLGQAVPESRWDTVLAGMFLG